MRIDSSIAFVPVGGNQSMVGAAGVSIPSVSTVDLLGEGVGQAPTSVIGNTTTFGADLGIGGDRMLLDVVTGSAAFATSNACTLNVALQMAPDLGPTGGYQPGTWQTVLETGPLTVAQLLASTRIARFDWAAAFPENLNPRYARLLFQVPAAENFTTGTIAYAIVTPARDDQSNRYAQRNYTVA